MKFTLLITISFIFFSASAQPEAEIFKQYKSDKNNAALPDFSYAGYRTGKTDFPTGKGLKVFNVTDYGAVPDDHISDKQAIEKTIAAAEKAKGGIVFFPKGRFLVQEDGDEASSIWISGSHIIFRGSGSGNEGTELFMKNPLNPADPEKMWSVPPLFIFGSKKGETAVGNITSNAPIGDFSFSMDKTSGLKKGDWILLEMSSKDSASIRLDLGDLPVNPDWTSLYNGGVQLKVVHQITGIKGNKITLKQPLAYPVKAGLGWKVSKYNAIEEVGIEDIAFTGNWKEPFVHHKSWLHDSGFTLINMRRIVNSWMKNCRFTDVSVAAIVNSGANISIIDCEVTGNAGHEAITNAGGTNVLLGRIHDKASMWHSVGTSKTAMNTVVWRVTYPANTCFESHASQPRNTLLDCVEGGLLDNRGGGAIASMPNHMRNLVMWNYKQTNAPYEAFEFWPNRRYWKIPYPIIVGFHGTGTKFKNEQLGYAESIGAKVSPGSLYEAQLQHRLGRLPGWMKKKN